MAGTHTPAGVGAFVDYYVDVITHAVRTGTTRMLRDVAAPGCKGCDQIATSIEEVYDGGGFIVSEGWKLVAHEMRSFDGDAVVSLTVTQSPALTYASASAAPTETPLQISTITLRLVAQRVGWLVARMDVRSS